jgi:hypothetical protein
MQLLFSIAASIDLPTVFGGHTYDTGASPSRESSGADRGGGIGTASIVAVLLVTLLTVGLLVWLNPSTARARLRSVGPLALMGAIVAAPLIVWATSSGGADPSLIVERATTPSGAPELIVSLSNEDLNTLRTTKGRRVVRLECRGREGEVVLNAGKRWPFIDEAGYEYPHVHQRVSREQLRAADHCRLRSTRTRLDAPVEGGLAR